MTKQIYPLDEESVLFSGTISSQQNRLFFERHLMNMTVEEILAMRIFKFFSMKVLIPLLKKGKLFIDRVKTWEDVYENFFLKETFYSKFLEANIDTAE